MALPVVVSKVGVSEPLRSAAVVARGLFWPAVDLGTVADLGTGSTFFWFFLDGASGWGHSTSWVRSSRSAPTHSERPLVIYTSKVAEIEQTIKSFIEVNIMNAAQQSIPLRLGKRTKSY